jgi:hypothetical protein
VGPILSSSAVMNREPGLQRTTLGSQLKDEVRTGDIFGHHAQKGHVLEPTAGAMSLLWAPLTCQGDGVASQPAQALGEESFQNLGLRGHQWR